MEKSKIKNNKYKTGKCKNCGRSCGAGCFVCGLCYVKVFSNNKNNKYDEWRANYTKKVKSRQKQQ